MERRWGLLFLMLSACEPEPKGPVQVVVPEAMRFETEHIRNEVDQYKTEPTAAARRRMEQAFGTFDARVKAMEALAQSQVEPERAVTERLIADLKHRRELHWIRAQTALAETQPVTRAEPVGERVTRAERLDRPQRSKRMRYPPVQRIEQRPRPMNLFQRFFR